MAAEPQLFRINPENRESEKITEVEFSHLGFQERRDIQEWVAANPGILGEELLIIGKEFSGFDRTNERLDLLAVDEDGKLVVIELKRDHSGSDAHWQAIKYASYLHRARHEDIIRMFADYADISETEAVDELLQHLGADDLNGLNNDQRIILASHRFAPEVTSASLWLNEKTPDEDMITCVQLIPYHDSQTDSLYIQANTIIPMLGAEEYSIGIGDRLDASEDSNGRQSDLGIKLRRAFQRNRNDEVTPFLRNAASLAIEGLPNEIKPDRMSKWAAGWPDFRYYNLWYSRPPWWHSKKRLMNYQIALQPLDGGLFKAAARLEILKPAMMKASDYTDANFDKLKNIVSNAEWIQIDNESPLNENLQERISQTLRSLIEELTPEVERFEDERTNQESRPHDPPPPPPLLPPRHPPRRGRRPLHCRAHSGRRPHPTRPRARPNPERPRQNHRRTRLGRPLSPTLRRLSNGRRSRSLSRHHWRVRDRAPHPQRSPNKADWVDTGDPIPDQFDAVIMVEVVRRLDDSAIEIRAPVPPYNHVRPLGEDIVESELLLPQNHRLRPADLGACAAAGVTQIAVRPRSPAVVIIPNRHRTR